jgi:nucleoside-diphosphate-sugar epimerase
MLIYASSLSVHGHVEEDVVDEATPVRYPNIYGGSKFLAERQIEAESDCLPAFAIRLPGVLGTGAPNRAWIPSLTARLRRHEDVTIYNPTAAFNNAAHVCDLGSFCLHLLQSETEGFKAFPVGAGGTITIAEAVGVLASTIGSRSRILIDQSRSTSFTISSTQAYSLGYRPMGVEDMLRRFAVESSRSRL